MYSVETLTRSHLLERPLCVLTFRFSFIAFHALQPFSVNTPTMHTKGARGTTSTNPKLLEAHAPPLHLILRALQYHRFRVRPNQSRFTAIGHPGMSSSRSGSASPAHF